MKATTTVRAALQALQERDVDRHIAYVTDDVVLEVLTNYQPPVRGKMAYRQHIEVLSQVSPEVGIANFELVIPEQAVDASSEVTWIHAVVNMRTVTFDEGEQVRFDVIPGDMFFAVRYGMIEHIKTAPGSTAKSWHYTDEDSDA